MFTRVLSLKSKALLKLWLEKDEDMLRVALSTLSKGNHKDESEKYCQGLIYGLLIAFKSLGVPGATVMNSLIDLFPPDYEKRKLTDYLYEECPHCRGGELIEQFGLCQRCNNTGLAPNRKKIHIGGGKYAKLF